MKHKIALARCCRSTDILDLKQNLYRQKEEYNELFGLNVISRQEGNVIMSESLLLQDVKSAQI